MQIPETMRAVVLSDYHDDLSAAIEQLTVASRPTPSPGKGQVLVRMAAAPCNQSDLLFLRGRYGLRKRLPTVPGWEGSGEVVAAGSGWLGAALVGKRVACGGQDEGDGTWAEYYVAEAANCVPLPDDISWEAGASFIVNPLTALGLLDRVRQRRARAAIQTAALSQLGRMMVRLFELEEVPLISIVRRPEQLARLTELGAPFALNAADPDFGDALHDAIERLDARIAFDAVGGAMTGRLVNAMPAGSEVVVYGALSDDLLGGIDPIEVIFRDKRVTGFFLGGWLQEGGFVRVLHRTRQVSRLMREGILTTTYAHRVPLAEAARGLAAYANDFTAGKLLIHCTPDAG